MEGNGKKAHFEGGGGATSPATPRLVAPRSTGAEAGAPAAPRAPGLPAETLARALQSRSSAPRRGGKSLHALTNMEAARRYARAKALLARQAQAAQAAAQPGPTPKDSVVEPAQAPEPTRFGRWCQRLARRVLRRTEGWSRYAIAGLSVLGAAVLVVRHDARLWLPSRAADDGGPARPPAYRLLSPGEWFQRARERAGEGDFQRALGTVDYALAQRPKNVDLLVFKGDMCQSLFQFVEAQRVYEQALRLDAGNRAARQNLTLCRRLNRYHDDAASHPSTLYGLHRVMLGQRRISEALAIGRRLRTDRQLQQATWQAALDNAGLRGKAAVDATGELEIDLAGCLQPDLSGLQGFPIRSLNLADTGLQDIGALRGLPLKRLDLSRTLVHDLSPLRGMPLQSLRLAGTGVVELSDLAGCPLRELDVADTRVGYLGPLVGMPLGTLRASRTPVTDLSPLAASPLTQLELAGTRVGDLRPLGSLGLQTLNLAGTLVTDLAPLKNCPLRQLDLSHTPVRDLSPLAGTPLVVLTLAGCTGVVDLRPLATCQALEHLSLPLHPQSVGVLAPLPRLRFVRRDGSGPESTVPSAGGAAPGEPCPPPDPPP